MATQATSTTSYAITRGPWLTIWLGIMAVANSLGIYSNLMVYKDLVDHDDPTTPHWPFLVLALLGALVLVGIVGLWRSRRWGVVPIVAAWLATVGLIIYLGASLLPIVTGLGSLVVLGMTLSARWEEFR